jgi:hypothetical protein
VRLWASLGAAAALVLGATVPFLLPYLELRGQGFGPRPLGEVARFSADVYSYLTAHEAQFLWGASMRAFPKPEGELFPSLVPVLLALAGVGAHARVTWAVTRSRGADPDVPAWRRAVIRAAAAVLVLQVLSLLAILARTGIDWQAGPLAIRVHSTPRVLAAFAIAAAVLLVSSRRARAFLRGIPASAAAFYIGVLVAAYWLSLGPVVMSKGARVAGGGLYWWLYQYVPGFDGLRVPARMGMIVALALAVLGGYGACAAERAFRRARDPRLRMDPAAAVLAVLSVLFLVESSPAPISMNGTWSAGDLKPPPVPLLAAGGPPAIYQAVRGLPSHAVLVELPFGDEQYDLRYMVYSAAHWRPLLNGYSGGFPRSHAVNRAGLGRVLDDPDTAWRVLAASGATHAIVHEGVFPAGNGAKVSAWLLGHGAREVAAAGEDRLFELPPGAVARICPPLHEM